MTLNGRFTHRVLSAVAELVVTFGDCLQFESKVTLSVVLSNLVVVRNCFLRFCDVILLQLDMMY